MKLMKIGFVIPVFMLLGNILTAQGKLPVEEVEVIKSFEARIDNASMLPNNPTIPAFDTTQQRSYKYDVKSSPLDIRYQPQNLRPIAMPRKKIQDSYNGYASAAYGLPNSINAQLNYAYTNDNGFEIGLDGMHNSANNSENLENQRYMYNDFGLEVAQVFDNGLRLATRLNYSLNENYAYAYDHDLYSFSSDEARLRFHDFSIQASLINSAITESNINYGVRFRYNRFTNNVATRQNDFDLKLHGTKWFNERHPLKLEIGTEFTTVRDTMKQSLDNFYLKPSYTIHGSTYKLKLGLSVNSSSDLFYFFPDAEFEMHIVDDRFMGFIGADGGLSKNTYRTFAKYNPFIEPRLDTITNTLDRKYYGGLKGQLQDITYRATIGYQSLKNLALYDPYEPSSLNPGYYNVLYDDGARYFIQSSISYNHSDKLNFLFTVSKSFYKLDTAENAYGLPTFEFNTRAEYLLLNDKLRLWAEVYLQDAISFPEFETEIEEKTGNFRYDMSLGGEYFFSEHFGVKLQLNNVFNNKYRRWYNSPSIGFQGLIGLTARF